jgi:hypothetical protein
MNYPTIQQKKPSDIKTYAEQNVEKKACWNYCRTEKGIKMRIVKYYSVLKSMGITPHVKKTTELSVVITLRSGK